MTIYFEIDGNSCKFIMQGFFSKARKHLATPLT
jgi:hypothetical protein